MPTTRTLTDGPATDLWVSMPALILDALAALERRPYDWDGASALPVREDVARDLRHRVIGPYGMDLRNLPRPDIWLAEDGTIDMTFKIGKRAITLGFLCHGIITWWKSCDSGTLIDGVIRLPPGGPATGMACEIDEVMEWLLEDH